MSAFSPLLKLRLLSMLVMAAVLLLASLAGTVAYSLSYADKSRMLLSQHSEVLNHASLSLYQELAELEDIIRLMVSNAVFVRSISQAHEVEPEGIADVFVRYGNLIDNILQLRWLDEQGNEVARVNVRAGRAFIVPANELQPKGNRYYFKEGMQVAPPSLYMSPLDLNIEHEQIVVPFEPTIRISIRTGDTQGLRKGILIINYNLGPVLAEIDSLNRTDAQLELINNEGFWMVHPNPEWTWGKDLQHSDHNLAVQDPKLWSLLQLNSSLIGQNHRGRLLSFQRMQMSKSGHVVPEREFTLLAATPEARVAALRQEAMLPAVGIAVLIMFLGTGFVLRDYQSRSALYQLASRLQLEMKELRRVNRLLDNTLKQQQLLKEDLAESKRLSSLGMMVAGVAHELNTPIGGALLAVTGTAEKVRQLLALLQKGLTKSGLDQFIDNAGSGLALAEKNLLQASTIIKSFRRLTLARTADDVVEVQLSQLVQDLLNGLAPTLKKSGIQLLNQIDPAISLWTQPGILSQVLQNLIINAVEHGFGDHPDQAIVSISARTLDRQYLELTVADNGCGVAAELIDTIFDPFVTSKRAKKHTGLGLHLVHQWVEQCLHGTIRLLSSDSGARFILRLPMNDTSATATAAINQNL